MNGSRFLLSLTGAMLALGIAGSASGADLRATVLKRVFADADMALLGEVVKVDAATMAQVPPDIPTVVFRVSTVLTKKPGIAVRKGDEITVAVKDLGLARAGTAATVFASFWMSADGLAVKEVGHEIHAKTPTAADVRRLQNEIDAALAGLRDDRLRAQIKAVDAVAIGKVTAVRDIETQGGRAALGPISEHMPLWREAVLTVDRAIKGVTAGERIVVRFSASNDVMWVAAPKFTEGQECVLFLSKDRAMPVTANLDGQRVPLFAATRPGTMLPISAAEQVEAAATPKRRP